MADATTEFFEGLGGRGHDPLLDNATGTLRFDISDGKRTESWLVSFDQGEVSASRSNAQADCVVRTNRALFDGLARGEENALASVIRGALTFEGNPELLVVVQRLFPGPPAARGSRSRR
jgi:putative sterol carrier protein